MNPGIAFALSSNTNAPLPERLRAERERKHLHAILVAASTARNIDEITKMIRDAVVEVEGFDRASVYLRNRGVFRGTWGTDAQRQRRDEHDWLLRPETLLPEQIKVLNGEVAYSISANEAFLNLGTTEENKDLLHDFALIGLRARGEVIGLVTVDNLLSGRAISEDDLKMLVLFCEQAAVAIANARLMAERECMLLRQRRLMEIAAAINASQKLDEILHRIRDAVVDAGGFDRAGIFLWDADRGLLQGTWGTDREGNVEDMSYYMAWLTPENTGSSFEADLVYGKIDYAYDANYSESYNVGPEDPMYGIQAHAAVPLQANGVVLGILTVDNLLSGSTITIEDINVLRTFATLAAVAIANARLMAERECMLLRQRRLMEIAAAINASQKLNQILRMIRDAVVDAGGFDRAGIFLWDADNDMLHGAWGTDREGNAEDTSHYTAQLTTEDLGSSFEADIVYGKIDFALCADYTALYNVPAEDGMHGVHAHAVMPLKANGVILGAITVDNLLSNNPITLEHVHGLLPFANLAATAVLNARFFASIHTDATSEI